MGDTNINANTKQKCEYNFDPLPEQSSNQEPDRSTNKNKYSSDNE